jgi:hypothetical protein
MPKIILMFFDKPINYLWRSQHIHLTGKIGRATEKYQERLRSLGKNQSHFIVRAHFDKKN